MDLPDLSAVAQQELLKSGEISATELLAACAERAALVEPVVNALPMERWEQATQQANAVAVDGPLGGLVTAFKDLADTKDLPTTYGSLVFADHQPVADHPAVALVRQAGVQVVGKTNTPEFGAGSHTFNPVYGLTRNPWDPTRSAGGSSGGAAAAVACGVLSIADGSDLGGSLRNPPSFCGVVGLRPTSGRVPGGDPKYVMATQGSIGRTVADVALHDAVLSGQDDRPLTEMPLRVAYSPDLGGLPVAPEVYRVVKKAAETIEQLGWSIDQQEPDFSKADRCFETLRAAFYAQKFFALAADQRVKATVRAEVNLGLGLPAESIEQALATEQSLREDWDTFFSKYDLLIAPTSQVSAFPVGQEWVREINGTALDHYTNWMRSSSRVTVSGCPSISLPAGFTPEGLPVGIQIVAPRGTDRQLLSWAGLIEEAFGVPIRPPIEALATTDPSRLPPGPLG